MHIRFTSAVLALGNSGAAGLRPAVLASMCGSAAAVLMQPLAFAWSGKDEDGNWPKNGDDGRWGKWGQPKEAGSGGGGGGNVLSAKAPGFGVRTCEGPLPKIAVIGGTGRMGVHLCAAWANAGYDVTICSRTEDKAQKIVDSLLAGDGYVEDGMQGGIKVPPCPADGWNLKAGTNADAAKADLIVLATMYEQAWGLLEAIAPRIRGKGKTILDMTNVRRSQALRTLAQSCDSA